MTAPLRQQLMDRIQRLPDDKLPHVETLLTHLECGDSSPLSLPSLSSFASDRSTTEQQRLAAKISAAVKAKGRESGNELPQSKDWPHAPRHCLSEHGSFIVTAGTSGKQHFFRGAERLDLLEAKLLSLARRFDWDLEAWAVFSNHYHFVANSRPESEKLNLFLKHLHAETANELNTLDNRLGRQVWFNFWESRLTFEKSYLARLNYVHQNAVRHQLVPVASQYRWCSAAWFERTATRAQVRTIYGFKIDKIEVVDDYEPL